MDRKHQAFFGGVLFFALVGCFIPGQTRAAAWSPGTVRSSSLSTALLANTVTFSGTILTIFDPSKAFGSAVGASILTVTMNAKDQVTGKKYKKTFTVPPTTVVTFMNSSVVLRRTVLKMGDTVKVKMKRNSGVAVLIEYYDHMNFTMPKY